MVVLRFHLDTTAYSAGFWWIDCPQVPDLYASGPTMIGARRRAIDRLNTEGIDARDVQDELVDAESWSALSPP